MSSLLASMPRCAWAWGDMRGHRKIRAVLFDLGNTLAAYYKPAEFGPILERSVSSVIDALARRGVAAPDFSTALAAARLENREAPDFRFSPMEDRLARIFGLAASSDAELLQHLCASFLGPIFEMGYVYEDALPALRGLSEAGYQTAIVSNAPWGSPPHLWRNQLNAMGLGQAATEVVLCGDVGWRKPAPQIFLHAATLLGVPCEDCLFVGDEPEWDVEGSTGVGMQALLIDRAASHPRYTGDRIESLKEIGRWLT